MKVEGNKKVAIQGYQGSFHHMAVDKYYPDTVELVPMDTFNILFSSMKNDHSIEEAVVAIENSIAGSILPNYQLLRKSSLFIIGEIYMQIKQNLLSVSNSSIEELEEVYSHPMAILQCEDFFIKYPKIKLIEAEDTALSAKKVKEEKNKRKGAIASKLAADLYGLDVLKESIETVKNNFTRFLILSRNNVQDPDSDKASINFQVSNKPGALVKALLVIEKFNINISKIQSVPEIDREWRYFFHLDLEFQALSVFHEAINELRKVTNHLRIFGIYKKGRSIEA